MSSGFLAAPAPAFFGTSMLRVPSSRGSSTSYSYSHSNFPPSPVSPVT